MMRNGHADEAIARTIGKSIGSIRAYRRQTRYKDAAERTGVADVKIQATSQRALADISLDEPFHEAVLLVSTLNLSPSDVQEMVRRIDETRSEAQALEVIDEFRKKHGVAGPPPHKGPSTKAATAAGRKIDAFLASIKVPPAELAPLALRAELEAEVGTAARPDQPRHRGIRTPLARG
jgi:hypothetical protein